MRLALERRVLDALRDEMMAPDVMAGSILAYNTETEAVRAARARERIAQGAELIEIDRKISSLIDAIENGAWSSALQERLAALESDKRAIIAIRSTEQSRATSSKSVQQLLQHISVRLRI